MGNNDYKIFKQSTHTTGHPFQNKTMCNTTAIFVVICELINKN